MRFANPYQARSTHGFYRNIGMKMTMSTGSTMTPKIHRKVIRTASKLHPGKHHPGKLHAGKRQPGKAMATKSMHQHQYQHQLQQTGKLLSRGKMLSRVPPLTRPIDSCDNSNDSGLGFDQMEMNLSTRNNCMRFSENMETSWKDDTSQAKICKSDLKFDSDDANDTFNFNENATRPLKQICTSTVYRTSIVSGKMTNPSTVRRKTTVVQSQPSEPINLCSQLPTHSRDGRVYLQIVSQPEQQHRARYQTEGSRGAVKDRSGNGFPIVKLIGYDKPTTLQVFIGTDVGRVAPHMFYQACRVFGKNSTPCTEVKEDGTVLIDIEFDPQKNWQVTCDCVGILKERNVDVEHRFGDQTAERGKKKSTRCRMVFRTQFMNSDGLMETIQICSQPIVCTQPPGVPEICRKSLVSCPVNGGLELFLLGKNFLKDTKIVFQSIVENNSTQDSWEECVLPDKEFLQQNHLVCGVPPFVHLNISEPVAVRLFVVSGGKASESHEFYYTPMSKNSGPQHASVHHSAQGGMLNGQYSKGNANEDIKPVLLWESNNEVGMMLPPAAPLRRPSLIIPDPHSPPLTSFKMEADDSNQGNLMDSDNNDIVSRQIRSNHFKIHNENSMDINDNSIDNDHTRSLPVESISSNVNMCIIPHSDESNLLLVNNESMLRIDKTKTPLCHLNESNVDVMMHHESPNLPTVEKNSISSYRPTNIISSQIIGDAMKNQSQVISGPAVILNSSRHIVSDELKVVDLRMKSENIVSENDPSLATFQQFVDSHNKLPTQSAQSVENYLSKIDNKSLISQNIEKQPLGAFSQQSALQTDKVMESVTAAIFQSEPTGASNLYSTQSNVQVMPSVAPLSQLMVTKQIQDSIMTISNNIITGTIENSHTKPEIYNTSCNHIDITNDKLATNGQISHQLLDSQMTGMDTLVPTIHRNIISPTSSTSKLDSLINSSVENHLSPTHSEPSPPRRSSPSHDIILSAHSSPEIVISTNSSQITSVNQELIHNTNALSPEIILNPQVSPTMMCSQDGNLLNSQSLGSTMTQQLLPSAHNLSQSNPDNLIIQMSNDQTNQSENMSLISSSHLINTTVKTPPTVEHMILNAAAKILTSAITSNNILNNENVQNPTSLMCTQTQTVNSQETGSQFSGNLSFPPQMPTQQYSSQAIVDNAVGNLVSQMKAETVTETNAMTQAVSQAVSQVFSQAVNQAVNQEIKTPASASMRELTSISDNELLSYINPSFFS